MKPVICLWGKFFIFSAELCAAQVESVSFLRGMSFANLREKNVAVANGPCYNKKRF